VSLVQPRFAEQFITEIRTAYRSKYKIDAVAFATTATDGASVIA
jgi:hypothetical protein